MPPTAYLFLHGRSTGPGTRWSISTSTSISISISISHSNSNSNSNSNSKMYFTYSPSSATSYGSSPVEIPSSARTASSSCIYSSWPRRSSLNSNSCTGDEEPAHATSYISDDDLFPSVFDDSADDCSPLHSPQNGRSPAASMSMAAMVCEAQVVVDNGALMRELVAQHAKEQAAKKERKRRRSRKQTASKKMSPIPEAGE